MTDLLLYPTSPEARSWARTATFRARAWSETVERSDPEEVLALTFDTICAQRDIAQAIERSRSMLALEANWDDEGAEPYGVETWNRMDRFLRAMEQVARCVLSVELPVPFISPAQQGTIDLFWQLDSKTLLINIPREVGSRMSFYGEEAGDTMGGFIADDNARSDLIAWITRLR